MLLKELLPLIKVNSKNINVFTRAVKEDGKTVKDVTEDMKVISIHIASRNDLPPDCDVDFLVIIEVGD